MLWIYNDEMSGFRPDITVIFCDYIKKKKKKKTALINSVKGHRMYLRHV